MCCNLMSCLPRIKPLESRWPDDSKQLLEAERKIQTQSNYAQCLCVGQLRHPRANLSLRNAVLLLQPLGCHSTFPTPRKIQVAHFHNHGETTVTQEHENNAMLGFSNVNGLPAVTLEVRNEGSIFFWRPDTAGLLFKTKLIVYVICVLACPTWC